MSRWIRQRVSIRFCANVGESATETLTMIRHASGAESVGRTRAFERTSPNSPGPRQAKQAKSKVESMLFIFYDIKGIVHKEYVLAYYSEILQRLLENALIPRSELWRQKNWLSHENNANFFTRQFLTKITQLSSLDHSKYLT
jgi:hypothetical protein